MLKKYRHHLSIVRDCIDKNQLVIKKMLVDNPLYHSSAVSQRDLDGHVTKILHKDMDHVSVVALCRNSIWKRASVLDEPR